MFIRPRRYRMIMAFLSGLAISVALLIGGYFYYRSNLGKIESEMRVSIEDETLTAFNESHPMGIVYVFANDKKAGDIIADTDLTPAEINESAIPGDAVVSPEEALGKVMRCDIAKNTVTTESLFFTEGDYPDDLRLTEYTVMNLPQKLDVGSFIDVRIMFPNGMDYIVLSKKETIDLVKSENGQTSFLWLHINEEEILRMSSAIVDASLVEGARLYAVIYVAPDIQKEAIMTYPANSEVLGLILTNPNIVDRAIETLEIRNREAFEEQMNSDLETAGKNEVYGPVDTDALPVNAVPDDTVPADVVPDGTENQDTSESTGLDGRL